MTEPAATLDITYTYPGDPPTKARLGTGATFVRDVRGGGPAEMAVTDLEGNVLWRDTSTECVCDVCNALVGGNDPCAYTSDRLYCLACAREWILPHVMPAIPRAEQFLDRLSTAPRPERGKP